MANGGRYSNKIWIKAIIYMKKNNQTIELSIKDTRLCKKHRPSRLLRNLIDIGFEKGWFHSDLIKKITVHGFEKNYWTEADLFRRYLPEWDEEE